MKQRIINMVLVLSLLLSLIQPCFAVPGEIADAPQTDIVQVEPQDGQEKPVESEEEPGQTEPPEAQIAAPRLESAVNEVDGIRLTWTAAAEAAGYYVLRRNEQDEWEQLADLAAGAETTEYLDPEYVNEESNLQSGTTYCYNIQAYDANGAVSELYEGVEACWLTAPKLKVSGSAGKIELSWNAVEGAEGYCVYRKTADTEWQTLRSVTDTALTDTLPEDGEVYYYTAEAVRGEHIVSARREGVPAAALTVPEVSTANVGKAVRISWNAVAYAENYRVYRQTKSGGWKYLATVSDGTGYDDSDGLTGGSSYTYTVKAFLGSVMSDYDHTGSTVLYLPAPELSISTDSKSATISWIAVEGASGYYVYRKTADSKWQRIAKTKKSVKSYTDSSMEEGVAYTYTAKGYQGSTHGGYDAKGVQAQLLAIPHVKASNIAGLSTVSWDAVSGAESYDIYRKFEDGKWKKVDEMTAETLEWTDDLTGQKSGCYYYTVRARSAVARSGYVSSEAVRYLPAPTFTVANEVGGVKVQWETVDGAVQYRVYRKTAESGWKRIATLKSSVLSYMDQTAESGTEYFYTVRAVSGSSISGYDPAGQGCCYLAAPEVTAACSAGTSTVSWDAIDGAEIYQIYRKFSGKSWKRLTEVDAETLNWKDDLTGQDGGTVCSYTVRAKSELGRSSYVSSETVTYLKPPDFSVANAASGIQIKWKAVAGASEYRVYRKTANTDWKRIATLNSGKSSYVDKKTENSVEYTYTVRAAAANSISGYDPAGISITCSSYKTALANNQLPTNIVLPNVTREQYGTSGEGRALYAYTVGTGKNHMVLNFAIHGWEDNWDRDGYELVRVAVKVLEKLSDNASTVTKKGWTVTVIPYANPDGIVSGTTNNGPGRCTTYRYNSSGKLVKGGVDLNRCFPTGFSSCTNARNYTGSDPLMAKEAKALRSLIDNKEGSGDNIFIDIHGWTQQILTNSSGSGKIYKTLHGYFPNNSAGGLGGGYASRYAKAVGYDACLFEFPRNVTSHSVMTNKGYDTKFVNAVMDLIQEY